MCPIIAVIFDLDGVIVCTDEYHYLAWRRLADDEGIPFDRQTNERLRGVSRMRSLDILLEAADRTYTDQQKAAMADRKNACYVAMIQALTPSDVLPGALTIIDELKARGVAVAVASSSRNAGTILDRIGLPDAFDAVVDGNGISRSKPDPQVFLLAAERLGVCPANCLVVEDAHAGVDAGLAAGMRVLAVGSAAAHPGAALRMADLSKATVDQLLNCPTNPKPTSRSAHKR